MKILIAGYGFVGRAQELILKEYHNCVIYDPGLGYDNWDEDVDAVVVCVSTPPRNDGACEMANVYDIVERAPDVPILIKSTISVEGWDMLIETFPEKQLSFSPEFLRQASWEEDAYANLIYVGGANTQFWSGLFVQVLGKVTIAVEDPRALVAAKAFRNSFLATKVAFFNQIYDYCKAHNINFTDVQHVVAADERIGHSHTQVTEQRGFGGHCFPKDMRAIKKSAQRENVRLTLIEEAIEYNNTIRKN